MNALYVFLILVCCGPPILIAGVILWFIHPLAFLIPCAFIVWIIVHELK